MRGFFLSVLRKKKALYKCSLFTIFTTGAGATEAKGVFMWGIVTPDGVVLRRHRNVFTTCSFVYWKQKKKKLQPTPQSAVFKQTAVSSKMSMQSLADIEKNNNKQLAANKFALK